MHFGPPSCFSFFLNPVPVMTTVIRAQFPLEQVLLEPSSPFGKQVGQRSIRVLISESCDENK